MESDIEGSFAGRRAAPGVVQIVDRDGMCAGSEVAIERDGLLLSGGVAGGRCECATDLFAVDGDRERGIALGIAGAVTVGIGILTDLEQQAVRTSADVDRRHNRRGLRCCSATED